MTAPTVGHILRELDRRRFDTGLSELADIAHEDRDLVALRACPQPRSPPRWAYPCRHHAASPPEGTRAATSPRPSGATWPPGPPTISRACTPRPTAAAHPSSPALAGPCSPVAGAGSGRCRCRCWLSPRRPSNPIPNLAARRRTGRGDHRRPRAEGGPQPDAGPALVAMGPFPQAEQRPGERNRPGRQGRAARAAARSRRARRPSPRPQAPVARTIPRRCGGHRRRCLPLITSRRRG